MSLLHVAKAPAVIVPPSITVMDAIQRMQRARVGAVVVVDGDRIQGMFSERDVMLRVVLGRKDPDATPVREVMTTQVQTINKNTTAEEAVKLMGDFGVRHLPIVHLDGSVAGVVEIRDLFHERFEDLNEQMDSLEKYFEADGIGG